MVQKAAVKDPIARQAEKGDLGPCHSPKLSPVNLDENFAAANEVAVGNHPNPESPSLSHSLVVKSSQHSPILETADLKAAVKDLLRKIFIILIIHNPSRIMHKKGVLLSIIRLE